MRGTVLYRASSLLFVVVSFQDLLMLEEPVKVLNSPDRICQIVSCFDIPCSLLDAFLLSTMSKRSRKPSLKFKEYHEIKK